ncbi:MAG: glycosyltransferase family 2 protein [Peptococcaceae bacterium]|jgi:dolichol-phosphate mannosyltransferase|nr:glycosyltransferase family 2 protein [Peptococcaceae bacterium]MDH7523943.1 glycosyltransferase family 2 protein [Peptococcaceae bacterium]
MEGTVRYTVIVPVYNEEAVVNETYRRLTLVMESIGDTYELLFVNDGSSDQTASLIREFAQQDDRVRLLDFSRNFGHQMAITAGMDYARGDAVVIIDADLQDPPEVIPRMIEKWQAGYDVVYARRVKRNGETLFKKWTAAVFYRTLRALAEVDIPLDTGDFRLIDRKVCEAMKSIREKNRFVRGLVSWVGFSQTAVEYVREERFAGETKYPLKKMLRFAADGIASFSHKPLKLAMHLGLAISFAGFVCLVASVALALFKGDPAAGWAVLFAGLFLLDGVILIALGIMGEYVGRIYDEVKNRPLYLLRNEDEVGNRR